MTRILIVETASPGRIHHKLGQILESGVYPKPEISLLCRPGALQEFSGLRNVKVYTLTTGRKLRIPRELDRKRFDFLYVFWTGEKEYRGMKLLSLRIKAGATYITAGDGNEFRLTWKAVCRHGIFRWRHPLPSDHYDFVIPPQPGALELEKKYTAGERVLILESAEPNFIYNILARLEDKPLFRNPEYTLFCRNRPEAVKTFQEHPMVDQILTHSETRGSWRHLKNLRRRKFDAIVLFMTGNPSYRKIKLFAFLLGVPLRRILIFNESLDCFFFNWNQWLALVSHRVNDRPRLDIKIKGIHHLAPPISSATKLVLFPFRFLWLLLVWARLRISGIKSSRRNHDYSLQLPPFPGA